MFADEGATLYSAHLSWSNLWAQSQHVDLVFLPYYVLVHFWLMVSGNIAWVRALSLFAYFGTIVVVGWTGLRIAGNWCGIIAAVLTATSTLLILKALNARPYALSTLLVAICAVFLFKWLDDSRARWAWAFSLVALLATAVQLFSLLAPASMLICVLVVRPGLMAQRLRVLAAPIALLAVVSGAWIVASMRQVGQVNWIANEGANSRLLAEVRGPLIGEFYDLVVLIIVVVVAVKVAAALWNRNRRNAVVERVSADRDTLALTIGWTVVPTVVLSIASFVHPIYSDRYVTASAAGAALLLAFVCVRVFPEILGSSRVSDQMANRRLPRTCDGDFWRHRGLRPCHRLPQLGLGPPRRPARCGKLCSNERAKRRRDRPSGPRHYLGHRLLPGERQSAHVALATEWRSTAICRRIRPVADSVFDR